MDTLCTAIMVSRVPKNEHCRTETNYVDLGSTNTVKVTFSGDGNQKTIIKRKGTHEGHEKEHMDQRMDRKDISFDKSDMDLKIENFLEKDTAVTCHEADEMEYADMYLNSRCRSESESEDGNPDTREHGMPVAEETESHYITTHEIQLTELDHDMDHELGRAASSCWDYDDDNLVYSFVDYASFKSSEQPAGERGQRRTTSSRPPKLGATKLMISTESECASSDDGARNAEGQIHVSIKASSQKVSDSVRPPMNEHELSNCYHESQAKVEVPYDSHAHCFIPAPGRQHLASKLMKGKDVTEYSSGASSSISELDDADKEVRNLTAKSFRSLACPYFDTIDLRPSSESSVSEHSLSMDKWSSFVNFNYRNYVTQGGVMSEQKNATCSVEMRKHTESGIVSTNKISDVKTHQKNTSSSICNLNQVSCHPESHIKCKQNVLTSSERRSNQPDNQQDNVSVDVVHKKAVIASSLLQNVISQKMRFEQGSKLDCGEGRGVQRIYSSTKDGTSCKVLHRQPSESGSECSIVSLEELADSSNAAFRKAEKDKEDEIHRTRCTHTAETIDESPKAPPKEDYRICDMNLVNEVKSSAVPEEVQKENENTCVEATNCKTTKMSHLFVPGSHFYSKESEEEAKPSTFNEKSVDHEQSDGKATSTVVASNVNKAQEITIHLRSIKENQNKLESPYNIASLLTPNITKHSVNTKSEKVPHFTVRDVRDSRCKLQTPIHRVRDVRKLVKSSYRLVPLESSENKTASREESNIVKKDPDKTDTKEKTPMVIKCHSVNTNTNFRRSGLDSERSPMQPISEQQEIQMMSTKWKESYYKRTECKMANQVALEKLKAAVKTMEKLYVFDRNEWRRKTEAPRPVTDSHVLSLIASEEQAVDSERLLKAEPLKISTPGLGTSFTKKMTHHQKGVPKIQCSDVCSNISSATENPLSPEICPLKSTQEKRSRTEVDAGVEVMRSTLDTVPKSDPDSENYLTIPIKTPPLEAKPHTAKQTLFPKPQPLLQPRPPLQHSPVVTESWCPVSPAMAFIQLPQIHCVTPPTDTLMSNTQCRLLMDPITGQYYLVDTPIPLQPITQRLYCPENAHYLDVPVALSPSAYFICPPAFAQPHRVPVCRQDESSSTGAITATGGAKPVISITSQQGPRIVAPPSFDGTTMSLVLEHR